MLDQSDDAKVESSNYFCLELLISLEILSKQEHTVPLYDPLADLEAELIAGRPASLFHNFRFCLHQVSDLGSVSSESIVH